MAIQFRDGKFFFPIEIIVWRDAMYQYTRCGAWGFKVTGCEDLAQADVGRVDSMNSLTLRRETYSLYFLTT